MRLSRIILVLAAAAALCAPPALAKTLVNVDGAGLALAGYDPVAFLTEGKAVPGDAGITATHEGATYRFASTASRDAFSKEPARYLPLYGGYCALGVAYGGLFPVDIGTWQIVEGRLVLNKNPEVRAMFDKDRKGYLAKAEANWPALLEKQGK